MLTGPGVLLAPRPAQQRPLCPQTANVYVLVILFMLTLHLGVAPGPTLAQGVDGATMTVLRGQVAVLHPDGSAIQPAPSGSTVYAGDEIRTIDESGALITFFAGTELELGANTILLVQRVSRDGEKIDISLKQVFGTTVSRVQSFTDAGSSYRVEVGGAVALVRGSELIVTGPSCSESGCTAVIHCVDCEEQLDLLYCGGIELPLGPGRRSYRFQVDALDTSLIGDCQALEAG